MKSKKAVWHLTTDGIWQTLSAKSEKRSNRVIVESAPPQLKTSGTILLELFRFSHFAKPVSFDATFERALYEIECICGNGSSLKSKKDLGYGG